jgi:hypothetical protein
MLVQRQEIFTLNDLIDPTDPDDEFSAFDMPDPNPAPVKRESASDVLPLLALEAALDVKGRTILEQSPHLVIIQVPDASWVPLFTTVFKRLENSPIICTITERRRVGGALQPTGADHLRFLSQGRSVIYVSQDPEGLLDSGVLAAADLTVTIAPPTAALLRQTIRRVTGGVARGVTAQMAALDLTVILSLVRADLTAGQCVRKLGRAVTRADKPGTNAVPLLAELPLTDPVRRWSSQLLADLGAVKSGTMQPDQLVYSMLEGVPGTGKSLIAESLARSAGWTFVAATVGSWFASGDGALGGVAKNVRAFIDKVIASEPAVGFLDEVDAIPDRATMDNRGKDWWTPVITLLLTEVDRLRRSGKRVLLIGATNYYHHLDSALIRSGRMQQRVSVLPPQSETEVAALFAYYLKGDLADTDLGKLARLGIGATPAMVEGWLKEARGIARAAGRPLQLADILAQMLPQEERSPEDVWTIALHEIGHALVACRLGLTVERVSIVPEGESGGHTRTTLPSIVPTWERLCDMVTVSLGGRAADIVLGSGANAGAEGDLANATTILRSAFERQGLRDGLAFMPALGFSRGEVVAAVEVQLARLMKRATAIVEADRVVALKLAKRLVTERILSGADITAALATARQSRRQHGAKAASPAGAARATTEALNHGGGRRLPRGTVQN